jgi:hypothetical protein
MGKLDAEQCRKAAEECRTEAERALIPVDRERWLRMAAEWSELARQAEEKPVIVQYRAETLAEIAKSYAVDISMISRLKA